MKIVKKTSIAGEWAKLDKDFNEGDVLTIVSEGEIVTGEYGDRHVFKMAVKEGEKNLSFNQTTLNYLVDAYGEDSATWKGKEVKVWVIDQNIQGKIRSVVYLTAPDWKKVRVNGEVKFVPETTTAQAGAKEEVPVIEYPEEPNPADIPF